MYREVQLKLLGGGIVVVDIGFEAYSLQLLDIVEVDLLDDGRAFQ